MRTACKYGDPTCPCQDEDPCHYEPHGDTPAMNVPPEYVKNIIPDIAAKQQVNEIEDTREFILERLCWLRGLVHDGTYPPICGRCEIPCEACEADTKRLLTE